MQIDKETVLDLIREKAGQEQAQAAESELPQRIDPDQHADLLQRFGVSPQELISKFAGGEGGIPGL